MVQILRNVLLVLTIVYAICLLIDIFKKREELKGKDRWAQLGIMSFVFAALDRLGIGDFATTTSGYKFTHTVTDDKIPGTLNVAYCVSTAVEGVLFLGSSNIDPLTCISMIAAAVVGAWFGAKIVCRMSIKAIRRGTSAITENKEEKMKANIDESKYEKVFHTIETHTLGEYTRVCVDGFPDIPGDTMIEKKHYLEENCDQWRTALMLEPKGHHDMFGSIITKPVHEEADYGVIFLDTGGYLNMCVHGSIGTSTALVEGGLVDVKEPYTDITLDAPAGLIRAHVKMENGKAVAVTIKNVPAFLYKRDLETEVDGLKVKYDIAFGGSFFALVDAEQFGRKIDRNEVHWFTDLGDRIRDHVNAEVKVQHPEADINTVDLVEFYAHTDDPGFDMQNVVIFGDRMADRSPCGTGTCAKMATLYGKGQLNLDQDSFMKALSEANLPDVLLEKRKWAILTQSSLRLRELRI